MTMWSILLIVLAVLAGWTVLAFALALILGAVIKRADAEEGIHPDNSWNER